MEAGLRNEEAENFASVFGGGGVNILPGDQGSCGRVLCGVGEPAPACPPWRKGSGAGRGSRQENHWGAVVRPPGGEGSR